MTRLGEHGPEVVLVHRPRYGDWTLPKGKVEPGETDEACAVRELEEETGLVCELGEELGASEYVDARGRPKRVRFWAARVVAGSIRPAPPEVDEVRFVPLAQADCRCTPGIHGSKEPPPGLQAQSYIARLLFLVCSSDVTACHSRAERPIRADLRGTHEH